VLRVLVVSARRRKVLASSCRIVVDATGLETRHTSRYYRWRLGRRHSWHSWPKLTVACDVLSHFLLGADVSIGPSQDSPQFRPVVAQAARLHPVHEVLGDKGYDAEHNHRFCREELGIATLIPVRRKGKLSRNRAWPTTPYRREMKRALRGREFGQRWQVESAFSRLKRRLGSALRARTWLMQQWECSLRVITHNVMLLAAA
jgi:hypothetical protein